MEHKLATLPQFDFDTFREKIDSWKSSGATTVVIEWNTGLGPTVYYYPAGNREFGVKWTEAVPTVQYNELYADFLEYTLAQQLKEIVSSRGLTSRIICADQQPILVMRMRRREIAHAQHVAQSH
jgi:hypothetical protein